jgi:hypothetical protein
MYTTLKTQRIALSTPNLENYGFNCIMVGCVLLERLIIKKAKKEKKKSAWGGCTNVPPSLACSPPSRLL